MIKKSSLNNYSNLYIQKISSLIKNFDVNNFYKVLKKFNLIKKKKRKVIIIGNGGSAAISSNVSVDFLKNCKIRFLNFNEADLITCYANDYGHDNWIKECIKSFVDKGDIIILVSSSGASKNHLVAAKYCKKKKYFLITFTGFNYKNPLCKIGNINFSVNSSNYNQIEMCHNIWLLLVCDFLSDKKF